MVLFKFSVLFIHFISLSVGSNMFVSPWCPNHSAIRLPERVWVEWRDGVVGEVQVRQRRQLIESERGHFYDPVPAQIQMMKRWIVRKHGRCCNNGIYNTVSRLLVVERKASSYRQIWFVSWSQIGSGWFEDVTDIDIDMLI